MKLVYSKSFSEATKYYLEKNENESKSLLNKMKALESYPPVQGTNLIGDNSEYEHAKSKLNEIIDQNPHVKIVSVLKKLFKVILKN